MEKISTADCKQRFAIGALIFRPESAVLFFRIEKRATAAGFLGPRSDGEALADLLERKNTDGPTLENLKNLERKCSATDSFQKRKRKKQRKTKIICKIFRETSSASIGAGDWSPQLRAEMCLPHRGVVLLPAFGIRTPELHVVVGAHAAL